MLSITVSVIRVSWNTLRISAPKIVNNSVNNLRAVHLTQFKEKQKLFLCYKLREFYTLFHFIDLAQAYHLYSNLVGQCPRLLPRTNPPLKELSRCLVHLIAFLWLLRVSIGIGRYALPELFRLLIYKKQK